MKTIGGNRAKLWLGNCLKSAGIKAQSLGERLIEGAKPYEITESKVYMHNPFYLVVHFKTNKGKFQLIYQGDYMVRYRAYKENPDTFQEDEVYELIKQGKGRWFKTK
jgi:hypothetical protein